VTTVTCEQYPQYNIVRYNTTQTSLDFDLMGVVHPKVPHPVGGGDLDPHLLYGFCVRKSTPQSASQSIL